jgi:hypothetical protein
MADILPTVPKEARVGYSLCLRLAARVWKGRSHLSATTPLVARQLADIVPDHSIRLVKQPLRSKSGRRATPRSLDTTSRQSSRRGNVRRLASRRHENLRLDQFRPIPTFWTGPAAGGSPVKSEIPPELLQQIAEVAANKSAGGRAFEHEWVLDFKFSWAPSGRAIYFERTFRGREKTSGA